jgi:hypothetical protein
MKHTEGEWEYERDAFGDWRATNAERGLRTRLKRTFKAAQQDVQARRVQSRRQDGSWDDNLDAFDRRRRAA